MRSIHGAYSRALITTAATGTAMSIALLSGAGPAWAHVHVDAEGAAPGSTSVLTFQVPGESEKGALTTQFSVALPNVASARTEVMPGWTAKLDRDAAAGTVRSVTWTAAPSVGIAPDQFALFNVSVTLPNQPSITLPATQTYSDGTVVRWDQPPLANGDEPEHPVPVLNLTGATGADSDEHAAHPAAGPGDPAAVAPPVAAAPDDTARWLAGGALVLAAVGAVAAFTGRRRT
ncbi:YcnI family protein [Mycolicibacterium sp.]|uniref:YcnI family copper-binding membrane protein n=1 Tax=Mycolicibacterium sp. TaxID=2320850 RepID=UPI001A34A186|nr:YcnI family protein [Mycolicibacterium sp.]MBJ7341418.1 YcnI family protein [Mycolicibacterium sp.]